MYIATEEFNKKILSDERQFKLKAAFKYTMADEGILLTGEDSIKELELEEVVNSEDVITMGSACSSKLTMKLIDAPAGIDYDRSIIQAEAGLVLENDQVEYIPLGVFYVSEVKNDSNYGELTVTAYDSMCLFEKEYDTTISAFPVTLENLAGEVASLAGVKLKEGMEFPDYTVDFVPQEATLRDMLCYIAGLMGCFARFNRDNELEFTWYEDSGVHISPEDQYLNEFVKTLDSDITVTGIVSGSEEKSYSRGIGASGAVINYENPYMTQKALDDIWKDKLAVLEEDVTSVIYSGSADEQGKFQASFNSEGMWEIDSQVRLFIGDILIVENAGSWENPPEKVKVEEIGDGTVALTDLSGEALSGIEIGCQTEFTRIVQWICEDVSQLNIEGGDVLEVRGASGWENPPKQVLISGTNRRNNEVILMDVNGDVFFNLSQGAGCNLVYSKVTDYRLKYMPCQLKWRGNIAVQAGDIVTAEDGKGIVRKILVMSQTMVLSSGLEMTEICEGDIESDAAFSSKSPTSQKITKVYSSLQEAIKEVTDKLTGKTSGFISFRYDEDEVPVEMFIMDTKDTDTAKKIWRWNSEGLGYSSNGINGPYEVAVTSDGEIVGSLIQADSIGANSINIDGVIERYNESGTVMIDATHVKLGASPLDEAIEASVSSTGGSNLIYNSTGAAGPFDDWEIGEDTAVEYLHEGEFLDKLISQRAFRLGNGTVAGVLKKTVPVSVGLEHTLSFKFKKGIAGLSVILDGKPVYQGDEAVEEWESVVYRITPDKPEIELTIRSEGGGAYIGDIMLCVGVGSTWSQASNEIFGTNVMLTKDRLSIAPADKETEGVKTVITSTGMDIVSNKDSQDVIASYTNSGTQTKSLESRGQVSAGRARLVPIDDNNACMLVINE